MKKLSIIIPCYNVEKYVAECLDSILSQTIGQETLEILCVDDCSTDGTVNILKKYEKNYPDIIGVILCSDNGRQGTARNIGLQYATGEYISFIDGDDWIHKDMYKVLLEIAKDSNAEIVQFRYDSDSEKIHPDQNIEKIAYKSFVYDSSEKKKQLFFDYNILNGSCTTKIYRKELLDSTKVRFAEKVCYEEPLFTIPLKLCVSRVAVFEQPLYYYRTNNQGTTMSTMWKHETIVDHLKVQEELLDFFRNNAFYSEYKEEVECHFIHSFFCEPFYFYKQRNMEMPLFLCKTMMSEVNRVLASWRDNVYIKNGFLDYEKNIIDLLYIGESAEDKDIQHIVDCIMNL